MCIPIGLPADFFAVQIEFPDGAKRLGVQVVASPAVPDAGAVISGVRTWWGDQVALLQTSALADTDVARKARTLADVTRLLGWLSIFDGALPGLDAASQTALAQLLQANAALRAPGPTASYVSVDLVVTQGDVAAALVDLGLTALAASGSAVVASGLPEGVEPLLAASHQIGGLLATVTGYDRWAKALATPCKPVGGLQVTAPNGSPVVLRLAMPQELRVRADVQSLVVADVGRSDSRLDAIQTTLSAANTRRSGVFPFVEDLVDSQAPGLLSQPLSGSAVDLAPKSVALGLQVPSSGMPQLLLETDGGGAGARLRAQQAVIASGSVSTTFQVADGSLGSASVTVVVQLDNAPPADLDMVAISPGTFQMGSPVTPLNVDPYFNQSDARPVHPVIITKPFWIGRHEVTQARYQQLMGANPSQFQGASYPNSASRPVENVSWNQAVSYCDALSVQEQVAGRLPTGYEYRLPTEAEWEYCCRAGTTTEFHQGAALVCNQANVANSSGDFIPCYDFSNGEGQTKVVGGYAPNAWGLRDMVGNVWELCLDRWDGSPNYPAVVAIDPYVTIGSSRVARGGAWDGNGWYGRSAFRLQRAPDSVNQAIGFRVVCAPVLP